MTAGLIRTLFGRTFCLNPQQVGGKTFCLNAQRLGGRTFCLNAINRIRRSFL